MVSNRLGEKGKGRERAVGLVKDPYAAMRADLSDDGDSDDDEQEENGQEAELMTAGRKRALSVTPPPAPEPVLTKLESRIPKGKGKGKEIPNDKSQISTNPKPVPTPLPIPTKRTNTTDNKSRAGPVLGEDVVETQRSMRDLKKEAFSKRYPPNNAARGLAMVGNTRRQGGRAQPNMGARMGALLEQIKRTK